MDCSLFFLHMDKTLKRHQVIRLPRYETYKLISLLVDLVVDNIVVDGLGFHQKYLPPSLTQAFGFKDTWTAEFNAKIRVYTH